MCGTQLAHVWSSRDNWGITPPLPSLPEFWGLVDHRLPGSHGRHLQLTPESFNSWSTVSISQVLLSEEPSQEQAAPELLPHAKHRLSTLPALSLSESQNRPWRKTVSPFHKANLPEVTGQEGAFLWANEWSQSLPYLKPSSHYPPLPKGPFPLRFSLGPETRCNLITLNADGGIFKMCLVLFLFS